MFLRRRLDLYPTLLLPTSTERWTNHLFDQIWSVREDATRALGMVLLAYPSTLQPVILELLGNIGCAKNHPSQTRAEMLRSHNDANAHTNSQFYSCGNLELCCLGDGTATNTATQSAVSMDDDVSTLTDGVDGRVPCESFPLGA